MAQPVRWSRLMLEGLTIVLSILLAFAVDAWWGWRQERSLERDYLLALRSEFQGTADRGPVESETRTRIVHAAEALLAQAQGAPRAGLDSLYWWMSGLSQQLAFTPPRAVFDDLTSSGDTRLIQTDSLRLALAMYPAVLERLREGDEQAWATWEQRLQPFLEGRVPRVDRLRRGTFGELGDLPFGASPHPTDWDGVLGDRNFESMLAERWMRLSIASGRYDRVRRVVDVLLRMIDDELR